MTAAAAGDALLAAHTAVSRVAGTGGYGVVEDVGVPPAGAVLSPDGPMHTYFLAETIKYLYLLGEAPAGAGGEGDGVLLPLDRYVFTTEAHPLPVFEMDGWGE